MEKMKNDDAQRYLIENFTKKKYKSWSVKEKGGVVKG